MKKVNFNAAMNFEVTESWIEKALNAKPKKKPLYLRPYVIGSAAGVVLAVAVTVFAVILTSKAPISPQSPVPVMPQTVTTAAEAPTEPSAKVKPTETQPTTQATKPTEPEPTRPEPARPEPTRPEPTEAAAEATTVPVTAGKITKPTEDDGIQYPYREKMYKLSDSWIIDEEMIEDRMGSMSPCSGEINSSPVVNPPPDMLKVSDLFTGTITVHMAADSPYNVNGMMQCKISSYYAPADKKIDGVVSLKLTDGENGEKTVWFNPYAYHNIPSGCSYTFTFTGKTANGEPVTKTVTRILSGKRSVDITI